MRTSTATSSVHCFCANRTSTFFAFKTFGLAGVGDPDILAWAAANDRIILTHDRATLPDYAFERLALGESMPGVFILNDRFQVGHATREILLMIACSEQQEWRDRVVHLPL